MKNKLIFLCLILIGFQSLRANTNHILTFGAISDTSVNSGPAIQKAIDDCYSHGGGVVIIPSGKFRTGTLVLKSHVHLFLEPGAVLYGSRNLGDYIRIKPQFVSLRTQEATIQLIYAENCDDVGISGFGEIDGQGKSFKKLSWNDEGITRPHLLRFITCSNVCIENVLLRNSGCWMQHYLACTNVQIRGIRIFNRNNFNNDGLDLDGCRNVTVSDLISDSDDDGITLKSTSPAICENITITNCVVSSHCNAIKLGTESTGGFKNIVISNCVVQPSPDQDTVYFGSRNGTSGVSLEIVDGGTMEGIVVSNIQIEKTESPLFVRLGNRARPYMSGVEVNHAGTIRDVSIRSVLIRNAGKYGCSISGLPGSPVHGIYLGQIVMQQEGGGTKADFLREIPEKPKDYPEATMFGVLPAYGFFIRHAEEIRLNDVEVKTGKDDLRPVVYLDDVSSAVLNQVRTSSVQANDVNIFVNQSKGIAIQNCIVAGSSNAFVRLSGDSTNNISVLNNTLPKTSKVIVRAKAQK